MVRSRRGRGSGQKTVSNLTRAGALFVGVLVVAAAPACGSSDSGGGGSAGTAGSGGSRAGDSPKLQPNTAARACALLTACVGTRYVTSGASCVASLERFGLSSTNELLRAYATCATATTGCTDLFACISRNHGPSYCAEHPFSSCDGDVLVSCPTDKGGWALDPPPTDCAALGMKCVNGTCTDGNTCNGPIVLSCQKDKLVACNLFNMNETAVDCKTVYPDGVCWSLHGSTVQCLPKEKEQCPDFTGSAYGCSGNVLLTCDGPKRATVDCEALDSDCGQGPSFFYDCQPRAHDCTQDSPDVCHGAALSICVNGRYRDIDCSALRLGPCAATPDGGAACGASG